MTPAAAGAADRAALRGTPSLARRMMCFVYEALLLFGLALIPGAIGAFFVAQTRQQHPLQSPTALRVYAFVLFGLYFVWFWSARGQTLAMQTWHIRLDADGRPPTQARALLRYAACCAGWFGPPTAIATLNGLRPWPALAGFGLWFVLYAVSARLAPDRQFWHDVLCGTRLVDARGDSVAPVRPRPR